MQQLERAISLSPFLEGEGSEFWCSNPEEQVVEIMVIVYY